MLTFIVSMRARRLSLNWEYHCRLLGCTLDSILAQTDPAFDVVVVCHDRPNLPQLDREPVDVLEVEFPPPARTNDAMCGDKVRKLALGIDWARARGSDYVMLVDADDLVSRRLAAFVASQRAGDGWYFEKGYAHQSGSRWLLRHRPHYRICGTGVIARTEAMRVSGADDQPRLVAELNHTQLVTNIERHGYRLQPLPFAGAIYVLHEDSTSEVPGGDGFRLGGTVPTRPVWRRTLGAVKGAVLRAPKLRPVTAAMRAEFGIPLEAPAWG